MSPCWFCKKNRASSDYYRILLHSEIKRESGVFISTGGVGTKIFYRSKIIEIPRCKMCAIIHKIIKVVKIIAWVVVPAAFIYVSFPPPPPLYYQILVASLVLLIAGSFAWRQYLKTYPELAFDLKNGWKIGKEPNK